MAQETTETKKNTPKVNPTSKKEEYVPFRELELEEIKKLNTVLVKLEKTNNPRFGESVILTIEFHNMFKKIIRSPRIIDVRKYNLIMLQRTDLDSEENIHTISLPVRYFERHDAEGEVRYRRFEIMFTRKIVISDFFDFTDEDLIEAIEDFNPKFKEDRDSTKEFTVANADMDYIHFK